MHDKNEGWQRDKTSGMNKDKKKKKKRKKRKKRWEEERQERACVCRCACAECKWVLRVSSVNLGEFGRIKCGRRKRRPRSLLDRSSSFYKGNLRCRSKWHRANSDSRTLDEQKKKKKRPAAVDEKTNAPESKRERENVRINDRSMKRKERKGKGEGRRGARWKRNREIGKECKIKRNERDITERW